MRKGYGSLKTFVLISVLTGLCLIVLQALGVFQRIDLACYGMPALGQPHAPLSLDGAIAIVLFSLLPGIGVIRWRTQPALLATFLGLIGYYVACWTYHAFLAYTPPLFAPFVATLLGVIRSFGYHPKIDVERLKKHGAFISYRRDQGSEIARLIRSELARLGIPTYLDVDGLKASHFDAQLLREIGSFESFILILTPGSLDRCSSPDDWMLRESSHAIQLGKRIIPVVTPGFSFPSQGALPAAIAELPRYQSVPYSHELFSATMDKLVEYLTDDSAAGRRAGLK